MGGRFPVPQGQLTIARSFNCGWRAANPISPTGATELVRIKTDQRQGRNEIQPSRWDELCWRSEPAVETAGYCQKRLWRSGAGSWDDGERF